MKYSLMIMILYALCNCSSEVNANNPNLEKRLELDSVPKAIKYAWLDKYSTDAALANQIAVPKGYKRVAVTSGSFAEWLRFLPLHPQGTKVLLYNGAEKAYQTGAYRVVNIDVGTKDLQQCADAVMRLRAEYLYSKQDFTNIHFNYTNGTKVGFEDWSKGKKPVISGSKVSFSSPTGKSDTSYPNFKKYLVNIFSYAGTASLQKELKTKELKDIQAGDVFVWGGFPGHAVLVLDVAEHTETKERIFLLAQSYMPAQSIHILINLEEPKLSPWYSTNYGDVLSTPEWDFKQVPLRKF